MCSVWTFRGLAAELTGLLVFGRLGFQGSDVSGFGV